MVELIIDQSAVVHLDPLVVLPDLTIGPRVLEEDILVGGIELDEASPGWGCR